MAQGNQFIRSFCRLDGRDLGDGENVAFGQFFSAQRSDGLWLATNNTFRYCDAFLWRFVADIHHFGAAMFIQM
jgi:hypothetical protein